MGMAEVACQRVRKSGRRQRLIRDGQRAETTEAGGKKRKEKKKKEAHAQDSCDGTIALQQVADCFCSHVCNAGVYKAARAKCVREGTTK